MSDLFGNGQMSLFGESADRIPHPAQEAYRPDPEHIRQRLHGVLETARAAPEKPWPEKKFRLWQTVFPNMANWLPDDEADQLRFEFTREVERLKAAA